MYDLQIFSFGTETNLIQPVETSTEKLPKVQAVKLICYTFAIQIRTGIIISHNKRTRHIHGIQKNSVRI